MKKEKREREREGLRGSEGVKERKRREKCIFKYLNHLNPLDH